MFVSISLFFCIYIFEYIWIYAFVYLCIFILTTISTYTHHTFHFLWHTLHMCMYTHIASRSFLSICPFFPFITIPPFQGVMGDAFVGTVLLHAAISETRHLAAQHGQWLAFMNISLENLWQNIATFSCGMATGYLNFMGLKLSRRNAEFAIAMKHSGCAR